MIISSTRMLVWLLLKIILSINHSFARPPSRWCWERGWRCNFISMFLCFLSSVTASASPLPTASIWISGSPESCISWGEPFAIPGWFIRPGKISSGNPEVIYFFIAKTKYFLPLLAWFSKLHCSSHLKGGSVSDSRFERNWEQVQTL